jgi:hypothetical protein
MGSNPILRVLFLMLTLSLFFRLGCHRVPDFRLYQPSLFPFLAGRRRLQLVLQPTASLSLFRRALLLVRRLVRRRIPLGLPSPGSTPGILSNWRRRRPLPGALLLLAPSLLPIGREGTRLGLPVLAPVPDPGWVSHPLPPFSLARPLLRLLAPLLLRRRAEVAQW